MTAAGKRSPIPLEVDKRGRRITSHGKGGYARGCGCPECTAAHTTDMQTRRGQLGPGGRLAEDDKHLGSCTVRFSANEDALLRQVLRGTPKAQYVRNATLRQISEDTGIPVDELDTARRAAPRSANYSERAGQTGGEEEQ